jgi:2-hydroxychromene-2-carboxylate isomerase
MGELIHLPKRRPAPSRQALEMPPAFFFDVSDPLSYLSAEYVERQLGDVEWVAVDGCVIRDRASSAATLRVRAEMRARALRLPLVWPDRFPAAAPCALRAAAYACEIGAGPAFALAAARLAFCGGFDLDDPETLAEAAAAARVPLEACLEAAGETWRDRELAEAAELLVEHGITELPAITVAGRWFGGDTGLIGAASIQAAEPRRRRSPLAPVG